MSKIILPGRPMTKKNSQQIIMAGHRPRIIQSKQYREYEAQCLWELKKHTTRHTGPIEVKALYWLPDRRGWPDLSNLFEASADILEKAGIIENDKLIISWDGSRIMGIDKENPRCEIEIREVG